MQSKTVTKLKGFCNRIVETINITSWQYNAIVSGSCHATVFVKGFFFSSISNTSFRYAPGCYCDASLRCKNTDDVY